LASFIIGLNFGIDFRGGVLLELRSINGNANISELRKNLEDFNLGEVSIQEFGQPSDALVRIQKQEGDEKSQDAKLNEVKNILSNSYEIRRTEFVGPTVGDELKKNGFWAVIVALVGILLYIWFRFEWQFAVSAILALFHDVIATIGLFAFTGLEFNLSTVAAVLTIAGYSVNDTVVVFDRVRENLRKTKSSDQLSIINKSLNETLSRTITTSVTTLLALLAIYFVGGEVISDFTLAMIWGVMIGTYSSIFVASAFLTFFNLRRTREEEAEDLNYFNNE
jgi:preprotein translocase SecF subunit